MVNQSIAEVLSDLSNFSCDELSRRATCDVCSGDMTLAHCGMGHSSGIFVAASSNATKQYRRAHTMQKMWSHSIGNADRHGSRQIRQSAQGDPSRPGSSSSVSLSSLSDNSSNFAASRSAYRWSAWTASRRACSRMARHSSRTICADRRTSSSGDVNNRRCASSICMRSATSSTPSTLGAISSYDLFLSWTPQAPTKVAQWPVGPPNTDWMGRGGEGDE